MIVLVVMHLKTLWIVKIVVFEEASITLYAVSGTPTSGTMRVRGKVRHKFVIILIDSGNTHNFVDIALFS